MHIYFVLDCNYMPLIVTACVLPNADVYYVLEIKEYIKTMAKCRF